MLEEAVRVALGPADGYTIDVQRAGRVSIRLPVEGVGVERVPPRALDADNKRACRERRVGGGQGNGKKEDCEE